MKCKSCGEEVKKTDDYCPNCGAKQDSYTAPKPFATNSVDESQNPQVQRTKFRGKEVQVGTSGKIAFKKGGLIGKLLKFGGFALVVIIALVLIFGGGPRLSNLETASEINLDTYEPITKTSNFTTSTNEIFATFELDGYDLGTQVVGQWYYVTNDTMITDVSLVTEYDSQYAYFSLTRPLSGWPVGDYRLDILIDEEVIDSISFNVE